MLQKWKLRLKKGQSHAPKETGDERGPAPKCQKAGADDLRLGVGTIAPSRTSACGLLHDSDRETEADREGSDQCLTIYVGTGGFHWGCLSFTQGDLGIWEDRSHLESGALQAKVSLGDQMPAVRK